MMLLYRKKISPSAISDAGFFSSVLGSFKVQHESGNTFLPEHLYFNLIILDKSGSLLTEIKSIR